METYILDTNLFFNMESGLGIGQTTEHVMKMVTKAIREAKKQNMAQFYIPPSIASEIESFFEGQNADYVADFFAVVTVKAPTLTNVNMSAHTIAEIINEARERAYRGMKVAEEEIQKAGETFMGKEILPKKDFQMTIGRIITTFRDRYRNATRTKFIDSEADFELIVLTKELNGTLVSTDEGVQVWARKFGVKEMAPPVFGKKIQEYASLG